MSLIVLVLYLVALILFAITFFGVGSRFNLLAGGLFCWLLAVLLGSGALHG